MARAEELRGRMSEHDFELDERPKPRGPRSEGARVAQAQRGTKKRPKLITQGRVFASLAVLTGGVIIANAVLFQTERHPAPMFRPVIKEADQFPMPPVRSEAYAKNAAFEAKPMAGMRPMITPAAHSVAAPAPQAAPRPVAESASEALITEVQRELGKRGYYKGEPTGKAGPLTTQAIRDFQFAQRLAVDGKASEQLLREVQSVRVTMKDELMDLVKRSGPDDKNQRTVMDVQRALNKAGYGPLTEDGQMGPSTKTALTRFEQDKKLPPRGEPKGPVLRALASASGVTIAQ